jgi:hypothetical protein
MKLFWFLPSLSQIYWNIKVALRVVGSCYIRSDPAGSEILLVQISEVSDPVSDDVIPRTNSFRGFCKVSTRQWFKLAEFPQKALRAYRRRQAFLKVVCKNSSTVRKPKWSIRKKSRNLGFCWVSGWYQAKRLSNLNIWANLCHIWKQLNM